MSVANIPSWVWTVGVTLALLVATAGFVLYMTQMPGRTYRGPLEPLNAEESALRGALRGHVEMLAARIGERNMQRYAALREAAEYVRREFEAMGYAPRVQMFTIAGREVANIEAELSGVQSRQDAGATEIVVIGAHYDSVIGTPGANDNATGVAALLELARWASTQKFARTVRWVAFVNEEPPYFNNGQMGSQFYAREAKRRGERIAAMVSLETIGSYAGQPQAYPFPTRLGYPEQGDFVAFVGNLKSRALVRRAIGAFRGAVQFPSEGIAAPEAVAGIGWSDHRSFWEQGWPAIMVTDTAIFRYPEYHTARDTPEIVQYDHLARLTMGLRAVAAELAMRQ